MERIPQQTATPQKRAQTWLTVLMAASAAWACALCCHLAAADRDAGIVDLVLTAALYALFSKCRRVRPERTVRVRAAILAAVFTLVTAACGGWFTALRYEHFTAPLLYTLYYLNGFIGLFLLLYLPMAALLTRWKDAPLCTDVPVPKGRVKRAFWLTFGLCAAVYMLFLLNQYPGSMESDHMRQLLHLMQGKFDNRNPLVNSLTVYSCVQLVALFGGSANAGVFLYSILQLLLMAAVFAFGTSLTVRAGAPKWVTVVTALFYALVPYNIFYSYGMWKDSFAAAWLLLSVFCVWRILIKNKEGARISKGDWAMLCVSSFLAALSRNSNWPALLVWTPCLVFGLRRFAVRKGITAAVGTGAVLALIVAGPVFQLLGVEKTADSITAMCIPLQQVGSVIVNDKALSPEQEALIEQVVSIDDVREQFDPACADPMKDLLYPSIETLNAHLGAYARLWVQLGLQYPMTYLRAYLAHLRMYIDPNVSSEVVYKWIYPNTFGVYRDPKLLPALDFGYYEQWLELPALNLLKRPGAILWSIAMLWQLCALRKNRRARLFYIPILMVYIGLFLVTPVALFRYVYAAAACLPMLFLWPFWRMEKAE